MYETGDHLLAGVAFSVGLVALFLAHSELFTENFLMPVAAVVAREGSLRQLGKLWVGTLLGGIVLVTLLRLVRTKELIQERRAASPADPEDAHGDP